MTLSMKTYQKMTTLTFFEYQDFAAMIKIKLFKNEFPNTSRRLQIETLTEEDDQYLGGDMI